MKLISITTTPPGLPHMKKKKKKRSKTIQLRDCDREDGDCSCHETRGGPLNIRMDKARMEKANMTKG